MRRAGMKHSPDFCQEMQAVAKNQGTRRQLMMSQNFISGLFDVAGKRALVTGATSGIGRMIASGLADAGVEVWIVARDHDAVARISGEIGMLGQCHGIAADVSTVDGLATIAAKLGDRPLHILVNNAGTNLDTPIDGDGREAFMTVLGLNLAAPFLLAQKLIGNLRAAACPDDPARIINIASVAALDPGPFENYSYSASKSGLVMLTRHLAKQLAPQHITCNALAPGVFPSRLTEKFLGFGDGEEPPKGFGAPLGKRAGRPEEIAGAVIYLSARPGAWVTGALLPVSGGMSVID